ncbi:BnaC04g03090D [Brassica napus]|uniref:Uncharacterized protein n=2 Tax=Brassica TaxID=3705 RepID=A0A8X7RLM4_BRACI|nr:protein FAM133 [Brassica napus]KAG2290227.1 hypothetical protein Bca52824_049831 [Brassica carinata]CAF1803958.1 unnamed protein product [Brassica napus]CDY17910.1 BnaC04g03090D [Brassica napus]
MGKNQGYKAMQRARVGSSSGSAAPDEIEDGMVDGSYHTPEWHAARLAGLQTTHTITWEEYKKKQKDEELKKGELEADTDKLMREYRAQLDAERAMKLSKGRNYSSDKSRKDRKERDVTDRKDRDSRRKKSKKRKRSRRHSSDSSSSSSSSSESSSSDEEESRRSRSSSKRSKREKKHKSKSRHSRKSKDEDEDDGPVPLSKFFGNLKKS